MIKDFRNIENCSFNKLFMDFQIYSDSGNIETLFITLSCVIVHIILW